MAPTMTTRTAGALVGAPADPGMVQIVILRPCVAAGSNRMPGEVVAVPAHEARAMINCPTPQARMHAPPELTEAPARHEEAPAAVEKPKRGRRAARGPKAWRGA